MSDRINYVLLQFYTESLAEVVRKQTSQTRKTVTAVGKLTSQAIPSNRYLPQGKCFRTGTSDAPLIGGDLENGKTNPICGTSQSNANCFYRR
jgi:hypothetical protein